MASPTNSQLSTHDALSGTHTSGIEASRPASPPRMSGQGSRPVAVDLFAGAGGLSLGFAQAGFRVALAVEWDRDAGHTYRVSHPDTVVLDWDAAYLDAGLVRHVVDGTLLEALIAGPPCQGYSAAGLRRPDDPRNLLFREILRLARELRPRFVVVENVRGILNIRGVNFLWPLSPASTAWHTTSPGMCSALATSASRNGANASSLSPIWMGHLLNDQGRPTAPLTGGHASAACQPPRP
jgi:hypothetical protein